MKTAIAILTVVVLSFIAGCNGAVVEKESAVEKGQKVHLTVDFQEGQPLYYKFKSSRLIKVDWDPSKTKDELKGEKIKQISETLDIVMSYTPIEVDPFGFTTIKAQCHGISISKEAPTGMTPQGKDAVKQFKGKSYTFKVGPTGKIEDYSKLADLVKAAGKHAFRTSGPRIKESDLIGDYAASQWFLWDSVSSIKNAFEGVEVGQSWKSSLSVPLPMVLFKARNVEYTLSEIRPDEKGQLAIINSTFSPGGELPELWPVPYEGSFRMSGTFGFLRGYKLRSLSGKGQEIFNIDSGKLVAYVHNYDVEFDAVFPMALGSKPRIHIKQRLGASMLDKLPGSPGRVPQEGR